MAETTILLLSGTGWLGRLIAEHAVAAGLSVTCLARGESSVAPRGVTFVRADRSAPGAYDALADRDWDVVIDVTWQPGMAQEALAVLGERSRQWTYISSISAYQEPSAAGQDEGADLLEATTEAVATLETYGEAKSACEAYVRNAVGERSLIIRPGLIGGPGDPTDRFGYWMARMARAAREPVLAPDALDNACQVIDVRDLAIWTLEEALSGRTGVLNAVGESMSLGTVLDACAEAAGFSGGLVLADEDQLAARGVNPWAGPRSLPLWLPAADADFFGSTPDARAVAAGLRRRSLAETIADVLDDERERGLDRDRQAGLTWVEERALISEMS